ncbi:TIGR03545 family protein [Glaciecola sp. MF2-115]|uniref:TIGR03545 family protein n=1 Tax=Glaciecola sp. MF2-115 TaxID=3384827 RepID=UPI00399F7B07
MYRHGFYSSSSTSLQQGKVSLWLSVPVGFIATIIILYFLFADTLLKSLAQDALGDASGAEVNIEEVSHTLFPFGLSLTHLQATDSANPIRNKVEVAKVSADVDLMPLLNKKLIVNELLIQDLEFDTKRSAAGEVYVQPDAQASSFAFPTLEDLPSVDELLEKSPLKTTAAVAQAQEVVTKYKQPIQEKYAALPSKEKLTEYKNRLAALKEKDYKNPIELAAAKKEFDEIKDSISKDKANISEFVDLAKEAKAASASSVAALKSAPQEDYALLKGLVAGDEGAIGQVTQHLFGEKAKMYTKGLLVAMDMLSGNSEAVKNEEEVVADDGLPNVWIKKAAVNIKWQDEQIETAWQNITDQHALVGNPTTFLVNSSKANNWNNIDLKGSFEIIQGKVNSNQDWDIKGLVLNAVELVPEESKQKLNALLESGLLASKGGLKVVDGKVSGSSVFDLSALNLKASGKNDLTSAMAEVISGLTELKLNTDFSGSLTSPSIKVKSDLDKKMLQALSSGLTGNSSGKLGELKSKLNAKAAEQLGQSSQELKAVETLLAAAQGDTDSINELLKSQMSNALDKNKDKLLDKLGDKLFGND